MNIKAQLGGKPLKGYKIKNYKSNMGLNLVSGPSDLPQQEEERPPRGFELVEPFDEASDIHSGIAIPARSTAGSAGYDIAAAMNEEILPGEVLLVATGVRAWMQDDEVLKLYVRSSTGVKLNLMLANGTGIIDSDYYDNPNNRGHIYVPLYNFGKHKQIIKKGQRIAQGIFQKYLTCGEESELGLGTRTGGMGSTGK